MLVRGLLASSILLVPQNFQISKIIINSGQKLTKDIPQRVIESISQPSSYRPNIDPHPIPSRPFRPYINIASTYKPANCTNNQVVEASWGDFRQRSSRIASTYTPQKYLPTSQDGISNSQIQPTKIASAYYALASAYGPGLYGNQMANLETLTKGTLGVAHKSLPLGTWVTIYANGRSVKVQVVDRGPYEGNREFDITEATVRLLGFSDWKHFGVREVRIKIHR